MKTRNKRLLTILIAAFTAVIMAGSAFAFGMQGPLVFNGTASVNATLEMVIYDYDILAGDDYIVDYNHDPRQFDIEVDFAIPGQAVEFELVVKNVGTMPATITGIDVTLPTGDILDFVTLVWDPASWDGVDLVVQPEDIRTIKGTITFVVPEDFEGWEVELSGTYTAKLNYTW